MTGLGIACGLAATTILTQHYFPWWHRILNREIKPPLTYVCGVGTLMSIYTGWLLIAHIDSEMTAALGAWAIVTAGGIADIIAYILDRWLGLEGAARLGGFGGEHGTQQQQGTSHQGNGPGSLG